MVQAGEWIDLAWTEADSIRELEILLSTDGGRRYTLCISPQLDPGAHHFKWRVPPSIAGTLAMRIRFNRGGHEIEGAPSRPLLVLAGGGRPTPLGLPPTTSGREGERTPRPLDGRGEAPAGASFDPSEDLDGEHALACDRAGVRVIDRSPSRVAVLASIPFAPSRSTPLRA